MKRHEGGGLVRRGGVGRRDGLMEGWVWWVKRMEEG